MFNIMFTQPTSVGSKISLASQRYIFIMIARNNRYEDTDTIKIWDYVDLFLNKNCAC